ncbi:MAG: hypothetical protein ACRDSK_27235 [Actinophytocola sp.]
MAYHEYAAVARDVRAARNWPDRLSHLVRSPAWSPEPRPAAAAEQPAK